MAGISLITKKWVRLIGRQVPGCLTVREASYSDGKEVALLDVFEAEFDGRCGSNSHPEDQFIAAKPWRRVQRFDGSSAASFLVESVSKDPVVLQGYCDRIPARLFEITPAKCSLGMVHPDDLWWWIREEKGKRRNRALFRLGELGRIRYDLAVTDPVWLDQLNLLPAGIYSHTLLCGGRCSNTFLTVSLSEPFDGFHYKLVAGVMCLPA